MYPLGKQFEVDIAKSKSEDKNIYQGPNYRISVISDRCIRLEYSTTNQFVDNPTQFVRRRNICVPDFVAEQNDSVLQITTKYFVLTYVKGQPFVGGHVDAADPARVLVFLCDGQIPALILDISVPQYMTRKRLPVYQEVFIHETFPIDTEFGTGHVIHLYIEPLIPTDFTEKFTKPYVVFRLHNQFFSKISIHKYHDTTYFTNLPIFFNAF